MWFVYGGSGLVNSMGTWYTVMFTVQNSAHVYCACGHV